MKNEELHILIKQAKSNDQIAIGKLYTYFKPYVATIVRSKIGQNQEVTDLAIERVILKIGLYDESLGEFNNWVSKITSNFIIGEWRYRSKINSREISMHSLSQDEGDDFIEWDVEGDDNSEEMCHYNDFKKALDYELDKLKPMHRSVFLLKEISGYTLFQIAEILGISLGRVKGYYYRTIRKLQNSSLQLYK